MDRPGDGGGRRLAVSARYDVLLGGGRSAARRRLPQEDSIASRGAPHEPELPERSPVRDAPDTVDHCRAAQTEQRGNRAEDVHDYADGRFRLRNYDSHRPRPVAVRVDGDRWSDRFLVAPARERPDAHGGPR